MDNSFVPVSNIIPSLNPDGTYTLVVSGFELSEIMKGLKYMERQRESSRKYKSKSSGRDSYSRSILPINIIS